MGWSSSGKKIFLAAVISAPTLVVSLPAPARYRDAPLGTAPTVSETFEPTTIAPGTATLLTITFNNTGNTPATLTNEFDDQLPSPVVIGGGASTTTCTDGNVSAIGGFAVFALNFGAQIPAQGSCTVAVCVTTDMPDTYTNTIPAGALQTDAGSNVDAANAMFTVTTDVILTDGFDGGCGGG